VRTREGTKPVFVSPGHRIDHAGAREVVLMAASRFRLPEPTRRAHGEVNALRRAWTEKKGPGARQNNVK
jgi:deoxyribonuclease V